VERAVHRDVLDPAHPDIERGVPCGAELLRVGVAAEEVGAVIGAVDPAAGALRQAQGERRQRNSRPS